MGANATAQSMAPYPTITFWHCQENIAFTRLHYCGAKAHKHLFNPHEQPDVTRHNMLLLLMFEGVIARLERCNRKPRMHSFCGSQHITKPKMWRYRNGIC
jgi:hypothetical protein